MSWLEAAPMTLLVLAGVAWAGTLVAAWVMSAEAKDAWKTEAPRSQHWWLAAMAVAALVRWLTPFDLVRVFTGWHLLGSGFPSTPIPRYGAGFAALLRPLIMIHPDPEWWIAGINASLGVATVAGLSLAVSRWRKQPGLLPVAAWTLALLPVLVRHHRSESALVVAMFAWLVGAAAYGRWLRSQRRMFAWLAVAPLLAAAYTRPAFALALPATLVALHRWLPRASPRSRTVTRHSRWVWVVLLWLLVPHLLWLSVGGNARADGGDLPALHSLWFLAQVPLMLVGLNLALWPHAFPIVATWLGARGSWRAWRSRAASNQQRWPLVAAASLVGAALLIPGMADPVVVSLPRLQAPWLAIWALVCAVFAVDLWTQHPAGDVNQTVSQSSDQSQTQSVRRPGGLRLRIWGLAIMLTALATLPWLFRPENADHEDRVLRTVATKLAHAHGTLYWLAAGDSGQDKVSRHHPRWRFQPPNARLRLAPLRDVRLSAKLGRDRGHAGEVEAPGERWVWLGTRCFAHHRAHSEPAPATYEQPACAQLRPHLIPVFEEQVRNHGSVHFPWWSEAPTLTIGLYRVP